MTTATQQSTTPDVTKLAPRRHKWGDQINIHQDTSHSGCNESEKPCKLCGLVKITVHRPERDGFPYTAFRTRLGIRFPDPGYTPVCDGEVK